MMWTVAATFVLAGMGQYAFGYAQIRDTANGRSLAAYAGDAEVLAGLYAVNVDDPWGPMAELLSHVSHRPGVLHAVLLGADGTVALAPATHGTAGDGDQTAMPAAHASDAPMVADSHDAAAEPAAPHGDGPMVADSDDAAAEPAAPHGDAAPPAPGHDLTGHLAQLGAPALTDDAQATTGRLPDGGVGFAVPLDLDGMAHALVVATDGVAVVEHLDNLRLTLLVGLGLSLLIGLPAFHVLGGRRLAADHAANIDEALQDGLTGLGNHRSFHESIRPHLATAEREGRPLVLASFDLDGFKLVNDTAGHRRGDEVLATVGAILADCRGDHVPYRVGGDEFAMIMPNTTIEDARRDCARVRDRINEELSEIGVSVGIAQFLLDATDPEALLERADAAMYQAKRQGRNRVVAFCDVDGNDPSVALSMAAELRALIESDHLDVVFQTIHGLHGVGVLGYEALVRPPAIAGFPGPTEMFATAERLNLVPELDALCRRSVLAAARDLPPDARLYLNVAPAALDHELLTWEALAAQVHAAGLTPDRVVIELTERARLSVTAMARAVHDMRAAGFDVALDDIGTGWAGFGALHSLRPDVAKIDRSIIMTAAHDPHAAAVLASVVTYASATGMVLIAEGVETEAVLSHLRQEHGDAITGVQGFLLGRPTPLPIRDRQHVESALMGPPAGTRRR